MLRVFFHGHVILILAVVEIERLLVLTIYVQLRRILAPVEQIIELVPLVVYRAQAQIIILSSIIDFQVIVEAKAGEDGDLDSTDVR